MKLSKSVTTVTMFSKICALALFIALPFLGFYLGSEYQKHVAAVPTSILTQTALNESTQSAELAATAKNSMWGSITSHLPQGSFLRDYVSFEYKNKISYLALFVDKGYTFSNWGYDSCPGDVLGTAINGVYHLGLFQDGKLVNSITLPSYSSKDGRIDLEYLNTKANLYTLENPTTEEQTLAVPVAIMHLADYTGDGNAFELLFTTTSGGCGFTDGVVAGYDIDTNKVILYSDWIPQFAPDSKGNYVYIFDCGNHGNETKVEKNYAFDKTQKKFVKIFEKSTPCI